MELSQNLRLALEHKRHAESYCVMTTSIHQQNNVSRYLFNTIEEYNTLKKANRFEPSWPLIRIQQAKERGLS